MEIPKRNEFVSGMSEEGGNTVSMEISKEDEPVSGMGGEGGDMIYEDVPDVTAEVEESVNISETSEKKRLTYKQKCKQVSEISKPLAPKKLAKKLYMLIKEAKQRKLYLIKGLKSVQKAVRKGITGIAVFAGDMDPIDIMSHMPVACEDRNIPYVYTPSKADLGAAMGVNRAIIMVLVREHEDYQELYDECRNEITYLGYPL